MCRVARTRHRRDSTIWKTTAIAFGLSLLAGAALAEQQTETGSIEAGILTCKLTGGTNLVLISEANYDCMLEVAGDRFPDERYSASIGKLGVDLSIEQAETLVWAVVAATGRSDPGLISGEYIGVSADAALGLGVGAHVLVGGFDDSITLQPLSIAGREGLGIAAGVEKLSMEFEGPVTN